jgi:exodeoxyribonuclease X
MRLRVIDIETSGGSPSEIIEIAAVDVVQTDGVWRAEPPRSRLFRHNGAITFHAMAIHHLTPSHFDASLPCCDDRQLIDSSKAAAQPTIWSLTTSRSRAHTLALP